MKRTLLLLVLAATMTTLSARESFKTADAEVKGFKIIDQQHAKLSLDFVSIFGAGVDENDYEKYLKTGYPKLTFSEFLEDISGGILIMSENKKLREFTTDANTTYWAHCVDSPHIKKQSEEVPLSLSEFSEILHPDYGSRNEEVRLALKAKHGSCYSQNGTIVYIEYDDKLLKRIGFVWIP